MPYITQADRSLVETQLDLFGLDWAPQNAGQLNFLVSTFMQNYMDANGLSYANVNEMVGALECMKLELYRLVAGPYEDIKADSNGPVYRPVVTRPTNPVTVHPKRRRFDA
jgi:hypothetical protein